VSGAKAKYWGQQLGADAHRRFDPLLAKLAAGS